MLPVWCALTLVPPYLKRVPVQYYPKPHLPATDADLHEVLGRHVGDVGGVEVGCGVHPLIEVRLLDVGVAVHVDDADVLRRHRSDPDRMIMIGWI